MANINLFLQLRKMMEDKKIKGQPTEEGVLPVTEVKAEKPLWQKTYETATKIQEPINKAQEWVAKRLTKNIQIKLHQAKRGLAKEQEKIDPLINIATNIPFSLVKYPLDIVKGLSLSEKESIAWHEAVKKFGTDEGKQLAQVALDARNEMKKRGIEPEQIAIELPLQVFAMAEIGQGIYNRNYLKKFIKEFTETKEISPKQYADIISKQRDKLIGKQYPTSEVYRKANEDAAKYINSILEKYGITPEITSRGGLKLRYPKTTTHITPIEKPGTPPAGYKPSSPERLLARMQPIEVQNRTFENLKLIEEAYKSNKPVSIPKTPSLLEPALRTAEQTGIPSFITNASQKKAFAKAYRERMIERGEDVEKMMYVPEEGLSISMPDITAVPEQGEKFRGLVKEALGINDINDLGVPAYLRKHLTSQISTEQSEQMISGIKQQFNPPSSELGVGRPPEQMGGKAAQPPEPGAFVPEPVANKIRNLYEGIEKQGGILYKLVKQQTILDLVDKGQMDMARKFFNEGIKEGTLETTAKFEDYIRKLRGNQAARIEKIKASQAAQIALKKQKNELRRRFVEARKVLSNLDIKHLRPEYQSMVTEIMDDLDLTKPTSRTLYRLEEMREYMEENPENNLPEYELKKLSRLSKTPIVDLTIEELEDIVDKIKGFVHLNKLKNKLIFGRNLREFDGFKNEALSNLSKKIKPEDINIIDIKQRERKSGLINKIYTSDSYTPERICKKLDGKTHGVVKKLLYDGINEGTSIYKDIRYKMQQWFNGELQKLGINPDVLSKMSIPAGGKRAITRKITLPSGKTINLTSGNMIDLIMHSKNANNFEGLIKGGFRFKSNEGKLIKLDENDLNALLENATDTERKIAELGTQYFKQMGAKVSDVFVDLNGYNFGLQENHYPKNVSSLDRKIDVSTMRKGFTHATLEGMGILKEKSGSVNPIIIDDFFSTIYKHMKQTSSYVGLAKPLRNAKMLLNDGAFKEAVIKSYGRKYWDALDKYLLDIEDASHNIENVDVLTTQFINKIDLAFLSLNPHTMAIQPLSLLLSLSEMNAKYLIQASLKLKNYNLKALRDKIIKYSPELRDRIIGGKVTRELGELGQVGEVRLFWTGKSPLSHKGMQGLRFGDFIAISRIWAACELEVAELYPQLRGDDYDFAVARRAEEVVRLTQPMFETKDRSAIGRSKSAWTRLLTKYTSQRNQNYNIILGAVDEYNSSAKLVADKSKLFKRLFLVSVVNSLGIVAIDEATDRLTGRKPSSIVAKAVKAIGYNLGNMYFVGDIFNSLASKIERGYFGGWDWDNPASTFIDTSVDAIAETYRAIDMVFKQEQVEQGDRYGEYKWKRHAMRAVDNYLTAISMVKGIPYRTIKRWLKKPIEIIRNKKENETEPAGGNRDEDFYRKLMERKGNR